MRDKISFIGRGQMKKVTLSKKEKKNLTRIAISLIAFITLLIVDKIIVLDRITDSNLGWLLPFSLYFAIYIIIGYDVLLKAARNIFHGQVFDENFLMAVATLGAFSLGIYIGESYRRFRRGVRGAVVLSGRRIFSKLRDGKIA